MFKDINKKGSKQANEAPNISYFSLVYKNIVNVLYICFCYLVLTYDSYDVPWPNVGGLNHKVYIMHLNLCRYFMLWRWLRYRFATKRDKTFIVIGITVTFLAGMTLPYAITLVANVFQSMIDYQKSKTIIDSDKNFLKTMHHFGIHYALIGVILFISGYLGTALTNIAAIYQIYKIREAYLRAVLNQDFTYFDIRQTSDFASKMTEDIMKLEEGIGDKVSTLVYNISIGLSSVAMALTKGWKLALLCLITTPLTLLLVGLTGLLANKWYKKQSEVKGIASATAEEAIGSIKTVYAFNGQQKEIERYKAYLTEITQITIKKELFTGLSMGCLYFCVFASYALSFYIGTYLVVHEADRYNADVMFSVFFGIMTAMGSFGMAGTLMTPFGQACGAGAQIFQIIDNVPKINPLFDRGRRPLSIEGNIEFKNVTFNYPSRPEVPILRDVSLTVQRGQSVALVGASGSGKSTIIHLLSRYYDVEQGSVSIDGNDVRDLSVRWLRAQIGLVEQEPVLFNTSVRENIRYGREGASQDDIEAAAKQANAHSFITKLPDGYDTMVGQRGESLSGGQKQRIAIARALIRNPSILLLDEATSALDIPSEAIVKTALDKTSKGRTTLIVAHRLSTIRNVDIIHVMKTGKIVESGNHEELLKMRGYYYDMLSVQEPVKLRETKVEPIRMQQELQIFKNEDIEDISVDLEPQEQISIKQKMSFRRVLALNAPEWKYITLGGISATINGFSVPIYIVIFGNLFGFLSHADITQLMSKVEIISLTCLFIGIVFGVSNFIQTISFGIAGTVLTERLRMRMFTHILQQDVAFFDERANSTGALCARLSNDAAQVQGATGQRIGILLQSIGSVGLALALGMVFEWHVGLLILAFAPIVGFVFYKQGKATNKESSGSHVSTIAVEAVNNIRTVASLGMEQKVLSRYLAELQPVIRASIYNAHCRGVLNGLSRSIFNFINAAALTYGGHLIVSKGIAPENVLVTTQALQMASTQIQNAFAFAPDFHKGINAASRILRFLEIRAKIIDADRLAVNSFKSQGEASLENVVFKYPTRPTVLVLLGLSIEVPKGKTIAVVGPSGCGKSTIIQLLQRYYDPHSGVISLDKIPVPQIRLNDVRSSFGLVSQEPVLFDRSIRDNIAYGENSRPLADEDIYEAAKQANIHKFVVSLPQGYDTSIGSKGVQLSGGQKQRVAIARALVRQPKILLLDEATSALDTESERVVQEALDVAKAGRTSVVIAHRLSTVRDADRIYVLSGGRVAESGDHAQLMQLGGLYYNLHRQGQS